MGETYGRDLWERLVGATFSRDSLLAPTLCVVVPAVLLALEMIVLRVVAAARAGFCS